VVDNAKGLELEVQAALAHSDQKDAQAFAEELSRRLQHLLPQAVKVRHKKLLFIDQGFESVSLLLGEVEYHLRIQDGRLEAGRGHHVAGIRLSLEPLPVEVWLEEVSAAIAQEAQRNAGVREALRRFIA